MAEPVQLRLSWRTALGKLAVYGEGVASVRTFAGDELQIERGAVRALLNRGLVEPVGYSSPQWYRITATGRRWLKEHGDG